MCWQEDIYEALNFMIGFNSSTAQFFVEKFPQQGGFFEQNPEYMMFLQLVCENFNRLASKERKK